MLFHDYIRIVADTLITKVKNWSDSLKFKVPWFIIPRLLRGVDGITRWKSLLSENAVISDAGKRQLCYWQTLSLVLFEWPTCLHLRWILYVSSATKLIWSELLIHRHWITIAIFKLIQFLLVLKRQEVFIGTQLFPPRVKKILGWIKLH